MCKGDVQTRTASCIAEDVVSQSCREALYPRDKGECIAFLARAERALETFQSDLSYTSGK